MVAPVGTWVRNLANRVNPPKPPVATPAPIRSGQFQMPASLSGLHVNPHLPAATAAGNANVFASSAEGLETHAPTNKQWTGLGVLTGSPSVFKQPRI